MSISGKYVKTFLEASHAMACDVSMDGDYDFWLKIEKIEGQKVILVNKECFDIKVGKEYEYFVRPHNGLYSKVFHCKPEKIRYVPFREGDPR